MECRPDDDEVEELTINSAEMQFQKGDGSSHSFPLPMLLSGSSTGTTNILENVFLQCR